MSGSCTFEVSDTGSNAKDTSELNLFGVQEPECTAGEEKREQRNDGRWEIYVCQDDGMGYTLDETCAEDEKAEAQGDGEFSCEPIKPGDEVCGNGLDDDGDGDVDEDCQGGEEVCNNGKDDDGDGKVDENCGKSWLEQVHTALSVLAGLVVGFLGYKGSRWVDGEYQVKGGFKLFASRSLSRVKRGRLQVGVIGGIVAFAAGTLVALQIPLLVQLIVIVGAGAIAYYFR